MIKTTSLGITRYPLGKKKSKTTYLLPHKKKFHTDNKPKVKISEPFAETKKVHFSYKY